MDETQQSTDTVNYTCLADKVPLPEATRYLVGAGQIVLGNCPGKLSCEIVHFVYFGPENLLLLITKRLKLFVIFSISVLSSVVCYFSLTL